MLTKLKAGEQNTWYDLDAKLLSVGAVSKNNKGDGYNHVIELQFRGGIVIQLRTFADAEGANELKNIKKSLAKCTSRTVHIKGSVRQGVYNKGATLSRNADDAIRITAGDDILYKHGCVAKGGDSASDTASDSASSDTASSDTASSDTASEVSHKRHKKDKKSKNKDTDKQTSMNKGTEAIVAAVVAQLKPAFAELRRRVAAVATDASAGAAALGQRFAAIETAVQNLQESPPRARPGHGEPSTTRKATDAADPCPTPKVKEVDVMEELLGSPMAGKPGSPPPPPPSLPSPSKEASLLKTKAATKAKATKRNRACHA